MLDEKRVTLNIYSYIIFYISNTRTKTNFSGRFFVTNFFNNTTNFSDRFILIKFCKNTCLLVIDHITMLTSCLRNFKS